MEKYVNTPHTYTLSVSEFEEEYTALCGDLDMFKKVKAAGERDLCSHITATRNFCDILMHVAQEKKLFTESFGVSFLRFTKG